MIGLPAQLSPIQRIPPSSLPPFNYPPQSKSHSSLFAHSFEWRETVVEKETDICACFPDPSPPLSPSLEWFTPAWRAEENLEDERERGWKTKREWFGRKEKHRRFTRLVSFVEYISSYIYDRGKSCFRRDSNNEGAHNGDERRKDKTCATLISRVDPVPS